MVAAKHDDQETQRRNEFMQALMAEFAMLQGARGSTISESSSRSSLYMTSLSGATVALALVAQASKFGQTFFIFALAILPVVFFLGVVTYYRLLQSGVEDTIYARAISKIRAYYSQIDPTHAEFFYEASVDRVGLTSLGLFRLRWQQFLSAAAMIAMVNAVVGGVFCALIVAGLWHPEPWASIVVGALATLVLGTALLRHQWSVWQRVVRAMPVVITEPEKPPTRA